MLPLLNYRHCCHLLVSFFQDGHQFNCPCTPLLIVVCSEITICTFMRQSAMSLPPQFSSLVACRHLYIASARHEAKKQVCYKCHAMAICSEFSRGLGACFSRSRLDLLFALQFVSSRCISDPWDTPHHHCGSPHDHDIGQSLCQASRSLKGVPSACLQYDRVRLVQEVVC